MRGILSCSRKRLRRRRIERPELEGNNGESGSGDAPGGAAGAAGPLASAAGAGALAGCAVPGASGTGPGGGQSQGARHPASADPHRVGPGQVLAAAQGGLRSHRAPRHAGGGGHRRGSPEYVTKLLVLHSGGGLGDAARGTSRAGYTKALASKNVFAAVEPLARADKLNLGEYYPRALAESTHNGKLVALPHITEPGRAGLIWNRASSPAPRRRTRPRPGVIPTPCATRRPASAGAPATPARCSASTARTATWSSCPFCAPSGATSWLRTVRAASWSPRKPCAAVQWQHDMIRRLGAVARPARRPASTPARWRCSRPTP